MKLLLIEDSTSLAFAIKQQLKEVFITDIAATGEDGLLSVEHQTYDLIIIDLGLPDTNGIALCQTMRAKQIQIPILILTAKLDTTSKVDALNAGADDYLTKPFSVSELIARIRVLLRRTEGVVRSNLLTVGPLIVDVGKRTVHREGVDIVLRRKEFNILEFLLRNKGKVITRDMLISHIWGEDLDTYSNTIDVHINYLREKIDKPFEKKLIQTIHGYGYTIRE